MSWAARLAERRQTFQRAPSGELTKPTQPRFVSFGGDQDGRFQNIAPPLSPTSGLAEARHRLRALADYEAADDHLIDTLADEDVAACAGLPTDALRSYVLALRDSDLRQRGKVPPDETAPAWCAHCGPVWVSPAVAAVAPVVESWPRVLGCPWCHVRRAGKYVPRPAVHCGDCKHFARNAINPDAGSGRCGAGCDPVHPFPNMEHQCARYEPGASA